MASISISQALEAINQNNPILGAFLIDKTTLADHSKQLFTHIFNPVHLQRQKRYKELLHTHIERIFRPDSQKPRLLIDNPGLMVSTADHHGILNYPPSVSGHLVTMLSTLSERETEGDLLFLDASKIPINEVGHRRGIDFQDKHINLFSKSDKHKLVYNFPKQTLSIIERIRDGKLIAQFSKEELSFLNEIDNILTSIDFSTCENFSEQIVKINFALWPLMFPENIRAQIRIPVTIAHDLILTEYLHQEFFTKQTQEDNFVLRSLFDKELRGRVLERFRGIYGCWDEEQNIGTHFFWYIQDGEQYSMWLNGEYLVSYDENGVELIRFPFTPEALAAGLKNKLLIASIYLKFSLISCWMGVKMMGGPNQIQFSTEIKNAWLDLLEGEEKTLLQTTETKGLSFINGIFNRTSEGVLVKSYFLDVCYRSAIDASYIENLKKVTIQEAQLPTMDINYMHSIPPFERQPFDFSESDLCKGFDWVR